MQHLVLHAKGFRISSLYRTVVRLLYLFTSGLMSNHTPKEHYFILGLSSIICGFLVLVEINIQITFIINLNDKLYVYCGCWMEGGRLIGTSCAEAIRSGKRLLLEYLCSARFYMECRHTLWLQTASTGVMFLIVQFLVLLVHVLIKTSRFRCAELIGRYCSRPLDVQNVLDH